MSGVFTMTYVLPLVLGTSFDARSSRPGLNIYDKAYVMNATEQEYGTVSSVYTVATDISEVQDALNVQGDIALKLKIGSFSTDGRGLYLKQRNSATTQVEILTHLLYISKAKEFRSDAKPIDGWTQYSAEQLGTHYVSRVTYGAELIASLRCVIFNSSDVRNVTGEVQGAFGKGGNATSLVAGGGLEKMEQRIAGKARLEISYYGNVPLKQIPNSIQGLRKLVTRFGDQVKEMGLGEGVPLYMTLTPLSYLAVTPADQKKFEFLRNVALQDEFDDLEQQLDELQAAHRDLMAFSKALPYDITTEEFEELGNLTYRINTVLNVYYDILWKLNISNGPEQLDNAYTAYKEDDKVMRYNKFKRLVTYIKDKFSKRENSRDMTSDTFVQWGSETCTGKGVLTLYSGYTTGSAEGIGGSYKYLCLPKDTERSYTLDKTDRTSSPLDGTRFAVMDNASNPFSGPYAYDISGLGMPCAQCFAPNISDVTIMPDHRECPPTWDTMYTGYFMTSVEGVGHTSQYICVDKSPTKPFNVKDKLISMNHIACTTVVDNEYSVLPKSYTDNGLVECSACGVKNNMVLF